MKNINLLTRSFTVHLLLLTALSVCVCVYSPSQMPLGQCCWPTLNQSLPGLLLVASSQRARTSSASVPSTTWAEASSAKRLTGWYCPLAALHLLNIKNVAGSLCNLVCTLATRTVLRFLSSGTSRSFPSSWQFNRTSCDYFLSPLFGLHSGGSEWEMSKLRDGPLQDKTVNELKLGFVKTWWVRWPSFISLSPINCLCRTSWVKYRKRLERGRASHRLSSQVNSLN